MELSCKKRPTPASGKKQAGLKKDEAYCQHSWNKQMDDDVECTSSSAGIE